jgi:hypothetical protein
MQFNCIDSSSQCTCSGTGCASTTTVECDGPADCPQGQVCCGTVAGNSYSQVKCASSCGTGQYEICKTTDGIDCQQGSCHQSTYLTGYHVCY